MSSDSPNREKNDPPARGGRRGRLVTAVITAALLAACAGFPGGRPAWVEDPYDGRTRQKVVAAVGIGGDETKAASNARAEVSRVLKAELDSELVTETSARVETVDGASRSSVVSTPSTSTTNPDDPWHDASPSSAPCGGTSSSSRS